MIPVRSSSGTASAIASRAADGEAGADRREVGVGVARLAVLVEHEHVHPQVRRHRGRVEVVAADVDAADLGDRRGEGVDEPAGGWPEPLRPRRRAVSASGIRARRRSLGSVRTSAWTSSSR